MIKMLELFSLDRKFIGGLKRDNCQWTNLHVSQLLALHIHFHSKEHQPLHCISIGTHAQLAKDVLKHLNENRWYRMSNIINKTND